jgi:phosphatidylglycerophosphatase A
MPVGWIGQLILFGLFRLFDAVKRGPVGWADSLFKPKRGALPGWPQGFGIIFDDLVAAVLRAGGLGSFGLWGWTTWQTAH